MLLGGQRRTLLLPKTLGEKKEQRTYPKGRTDGEGEGERKNVPLSITQREREKEKQKSIVSCGAESEGDGRKNLFS